VIKKILPSNGRPLWKCKCDCGNIRIIRSECLLRGRTKSCGCLRKEKTKETRTKHGMCKTPTYTVWCRMIQRCTNKNATDYNYYGDRGIKVCEGWLKFENFYSDMGKRPEGLTIERIDNDKGYYKKTVVGQIGQHKHGTNNYINIIQQE